MHVLVASCFQEEPFRRARMVTRFGAFHPYRRNVCVPQRRGPLEDIARECVPPPCCPSQEPSQHPVYTRKSSPSILFLRDHPSLTKRIERAWQLLLRRFVEAPIKRRLFQVTGFLSNVIAMLLELEWKPLTATHWINDLEDTWTFDLSKTFDLVPIVTDIERASMRYLWRAASAHRHGEWLAAATPDLTVRRHLHRLRKRGFLERAAMLQLAACGGLRPEQRRHEAFLQDHAVCPLRDTADIESEEHRFYFCKGNATGDRDFVDLVTKTDWILPEARAGLET